MYIPSVMIDAAGEAKAFHALIDEAWAGQGWLPRSSLGERGEDYQWALRCLLGRLGSGLPEVGPWRVSARNPMGEVQGEVRLIPLDFSPGVSQAIGMVSRSMWWPRIGLTRGVPPGENGLVWRWGAAGRWGFTGTLGEGREVVDEVLAASGWPLSAPFDYEACKVCGGVFELGHRGGCAEPWVRKMVVP